MQLLEMLGSVMASALPQTLRRLRDEPGIALSVVLHLFFLLIALWYVAVRPVVPQQQAHSFPVDLVALTAAPGPTGARPAAHTGAPKPARQAAPVPEGVRPLATQQPEDELSAKLRALAQLRAPDTSLAIGGGNGEAGAGNGNGAYGLRDFIRAQILRRWLPDLSSPSTRDLPVLLHVTVTAKGAITEVVIADQPRFITDKTFHEMALSARNAALLASPIQMPPGPWPAVIKLDIDLDPKAALQ
jgi:hypothetical protein